MTVLNSKISWCTGTLSITVGCTQIPVEGGSACDFCYAKSWVERGLQGTRDFETLRFFPERLNDLRKFAPSRGADGLLEPKLIFVNSQSDYWHEQIPDDFIHKSLDAFEQHPHTIMQILTKRPVRMRRMITERYGAAGIPSNLWLGVSAEGNAVKGRLNILRRLRDQAGDFTAFVSVEPIFSPTNELDFTGVSWAILGGESGTRARRLDSRWVRDARDEARRAGSAVWMKQWGTWPNNPLYQAAPGSTHMDRVRWAIHHGEREADILIEKGKERIVGEKGGATLDGEVLHEFPPHYHALKAALNLRIPLHH